ncbi:uncharacterized protein LOC124984808 [Sciurus carolinensis]|uniref:uncharacterized protein LOC124984808 n=1 Tax=Sciurus carolinensis TaxID=30640 RepID=UPI001FB3FDCD|nr:uncharacterized protein LOC124984808 [Sciurus carolinensis]
MASCPAVLSGPAATRGCLGSVPGTRPRRSDPHSGTREALLARQQPSVTARLCPSRDCTLQASRGFRAAQCGARVPQAAETGVHQAAGSSAHCGPRLPGSVAAGRWRDGPGGPRASAQHRDGGPGKLPFSKCPQSVSPWQAGRIRRCAAAKPSGRREVSPAPEVLTGRWSDLSLRPLRLLLSPLLLDRCSVTRSPVRARGVLACPLVATTARVISCALCFLRSLQATKDRKGSRRSSVPPRDLSSPQSLLLPLLWTHSSRALAACGISSRSFRWIPEEQRRTAREASGAVEPAPVASGLEALHGCGVSPRLKQGSTLACPLPGRPPSWSSGCSLPALRGARLLHRWWSLPDIFWSPLQLESVKTLVLWGTTEEQTNHH